VNRPCGYAGKICTPANWWLLSKAHGRTATESVKVSQGHESPRNFASRGLSRSFSNGSPGRARIPWHAGLTAAWLVQPMP